MYKSITLRIHPELRTLLLDYLKTLSLNLSERQFLSFLIHYGYRLLSDDILKKQAYLLMDAIDTAFGDDLLLDDLKRDMLYLKHISSLENPPRTEEVYLALLCAVISMDIDLEPLMLGDLFL